MAERIRCEFHVLRYVPNVVREEFVNVGIVLLPLAAEGQNTSDLTSAEPIRLAFTKDWERVLAVDPEADIDLLSRLCREVEQSIGEEQGRELDGIDYLSQLLEYASHSLQMSERKMSLAAAVPAELSRLMALYVEPTHYR